MDLTSHQLNISTQVIQHLRLPKAMITLSGKAGVGKTYVLVSIIKQLVNDKELSPLVIVAPTHKATQVIREKLIENKISVECSTLASFLKIMPTRVKDKEIYEPNWDAIIGINTLIIDESSMVSITLMEYLIKAIELKLIKRILFCGDQYQLPPVLSYEQKQRGIDPRKIPAFDLPTFELTEIVRQKIGNPIIDLSDAIRINITKDVVFNFNNSKWKSNTIDVMSEDQAMNYYVSQGIKDNNYFINNRILAYANADVDRFNQKIRLKLYGDHIEEYITDEVVITQKPIVIQKRNPTFDSKSQVSKSNPRIITEILLNNGDEFNLPQLHNIVVEEIYDNKIYKFSVFEIILHIDYEMPTIFWIVQSQSNDIVTSLLKSYATKGNWKAYWKLKDKILKLKHSFAMTIHKSQGSTLDTAFMYMKLPGKYNIFDHNRLFYVGVTRPSDKLVIINPWL